MTYDEIYERARHGMHCAFHQMRHSEISSDTLRDCEIMHVRGLARARGATPPEVQREINQLWEAAGDQL